MPTATLSLFRFQGLPARLWVIGQMALARLALRGETRLLFWKLCGSGTGEGFTPRPNWGVWAILAVWPDEEAARDGIAGSPVWRRWRGRASESATVYLSPLSARGSWSGRNPFVPDPDPRTPEGPLAVLTRASVKPGRALRFWRRVPDIQKVIGADPNVQFKIGIGEVPLLHQITFSIWPDTASMARFARGDGPHGRAIQAVRAEGWFTDELYARFAVLGVEGRWNDAPLLPGRAARPSPGTAPGRRDTAPPPSPSPTRGEGSATSARLAALGQPQPRGQSQPPHTLPLAMPDGAAAAAAGIPTGPLAPPSAEAAETSAASDNRAALGQPQPRGQSHPSHTLPPAMPDGAAAGIPTGPLAPPSAAAAEASAASADRAALGQTLPTGRDVPRHSLTQAKPHGMAADAAGIPTGPLTPPSAEAAETSAASADRAARGQALPTGRDVPPHSLPQAMPDGRTTDAATIPTGPLAPPSSAAAETSAASDDRAALGQALPTGSDVPPHSLPARGRDGLPANPPASAPPASAPTASAPTDPDLAA